MRRRSNGAAVACVAVLTMGCGSDPGSIDGTVVISSSLLSRFSGAARGTVFLSYIPKSVDDLGINRALTVRLADLCGMQGADLTLRWSYGNPECNGEALLQAVVVPSTETGPCRLGEPQAESAPSRTIIARDAVTIFKGSRKKCEGVDFQLNLR